MKPQSTAEIDAAQTTAPASAETFNGAEQPPAPSATAQTEAERLQAQLDAAHAKITQLTSENTRLSVENTNFLAKKEEAAEKEIVVRQKIGAGLSRKQGEAVWDRQLAAHNANPNRCPHPREAWKNHPRRS